MTNASGKTMWATAGIVGNIAKQNASISGAEVGCQGEVGLTCDPIYGLVQIPCIERNAFAAVRAVASAEYALLSDGRHRVSYDEVVLTMMKTGQDMSSLYRETALGGLAEVFDSEHQDS